MTVDVLRTVFILEDQYTARAQTAIKATKALAHAQSQVTGVGANGGSSGLAGYFKLAASELDSATPVIGEVVSVLKSLSIAAVGAGLAFAGFTGYAIKQYASFEQLISALKVYAGTAEETEKQVRRLKEVALLPGLGFREALESSVALQAVGFDARLAERALMAFGNALVSAGKGKAELDGIFLALSQIVSKGKISAEEINQIAERLPQIRMVLMEMYGTADTEKLQKMGVSVESFVMGVIDKLELLPKASGGAQVSLENMMDTIDRIVVQFGKFAAQALIPALNELERFGSFLERNNIIGATVQRFYEATSASSAFADTLRVAAGIVTDIGKSISSAAEKATGFGEGIQSFANEVGKLFSEPIGFLAGAEGFGDFLVRGASMAVVVLSRIPEIFDASMAIVAEQMESIRKFINNLIDIVNGFIGEINKGAKIKFFGREVGSIGGDGDISTMSKLPSPGDDNSGPYGSPAQRRLQSLIEEIVNESKGLYNDSKNDTQESLLAGDTSKGSIRILSQATDMAKEATQDNTRAIRELTVDLNKRLQGGGSFAESATSELSIARATHKGGAGNGLDRNLAMALHYLQQWNSGSIASAMETTRKLGAQAGSW